LQKASDPTRDRVGVNAVEAVVLKEFGWLFRDQAVSDYGIDAHIEEVDRDNTPTGKLVALQIKSGPSFFKKKGSDYVFYGEPRHLNYWTNHSLPVFIILHNPQTGQIIWQKVDRSLIEETDKAWSLTIPKKNIFDKTAKQYFENQLAATPQARRRLLMATHLEFIRRYRNEEVIFFEINYWVNKTINIREVGVYFGDRDKDTFDFKFPYWAGHYSIFEFMTEFFPWLDYDHVEVDEALGGEVDVHTLQVWVNKLGEAYADVEEFFEEGAPDRDEPDEPDSNSDAFTDEEYNNWAMQRALDRDRS
jgi:uncharacterized protein DUF4365